jgi:hypothetical protein
MLFRRFRLYAEGKPIPQAFQGAANRGHDARTRLRRADMPSAAEFRENGASLARAARVVIYVPEVECELLHVGSKPTACELQPPFDSLSLRGFEH